MQARQNDKARRMTKAESQTVQQFGERTRLACWHRRLAGANFPAVFWLQGLRVISSNFGKSVVARARQPTREARVLPRSDSRRVCSPDQINPRLRKSPMLPPLERSIMS